MGFLKKFGIIFNKKNIGLPAATELSNVAATSTSATTFSVASIPNATVSTVSDSAAYKTIAMFDLNIESPKFEGAIPEASIKFYPIK